MGMYVLRMIAQKGLFVGGLTQMSILKNNLRMYILYTFITDITNLMLLYKINVTNDLITERTILPAGGVNHIFAAMPARMAERRWTGSPITA